MATSRESSVEDIPFHVPSIGDEEIRAVTDTLRSGWITTGPQTLKFEEEFAAYVGATHAVACCSGTAGLHLAIRALGIGPGDEIVTTPYTFVASTETILYVGAKPVFVDIDPRTLNIDPEAIERAITPRTKAILPVHIAGYPCDMGRILSVAEKHGLAVLDDAAHALPTTWNGHRIGSLGSASAFSFYATKNLTTGEGGMVTTPDAKLAEKMRILRLHGIQGDAWKRYTKGGRWFYEVVDQGYKYNMSDIQSSMGRIQLQKLDGLDVVRRDHARRFREAFADLPLVLQPPDDATSRSALHLFIVRLDPKRTRWTRDALIDALRERRIYTSVHFIPVHLHPYYRDLGFARGMFPAAEAAYDQALTLPFYPAMPEASLQRLLDVMRTLLLSEPTA